MDQTRPVNIDCNNNNNNNDLSNSNNNSNINNKFNDGDSKNQRKEVIVVQSVGTKGKEAEDTWRGPEGEAGSRAWVVQVLIINSDKLCSRFSSSILTNFLSGFSSFVLGKDINVTLQGQSGVGRGRFLVARFVII